jgi:hypothetical protein
MTRDELKKTTLREIRDARWDAGRAARGLHFAAPFEGDPFVELAEEIADAVNYCEIASEYAETALGDAHLENLRNTLLQAWEQVKLAVEAEA